MTRETFERALEHIEQSFNFNNMLENNPFLLDAARGERRRIVLVYHAFSSVCSPALTENPLVIGGYVLSGLKKEGPSLSTLVTEVRTAWGPR